jgi:hypothetical protein
MKKKIYLLAIIFIVISIVSLWSQSYWRDENGILWYGGSSVGIGTSSPNAALHINNGQGYNNFIVEGIGGSMFVIDGNGNVGIGKVFPTSKLDVAGDTVISGYLSVSGYKFPQSIGTKGLVLKSDGTNVVWTEDEIESGWGQEGDNISYTRGNVGIGTTQPSYELSVFGKISSIGKIGTERASISVNLDNGILELFNSSAVKNVLIHPSNDSYLNGGNVGIGTTEPMQKLEVSGNLRLSAGSYRLETTKYLVLRSASDYPIYFETDGGTEVLRLTENGNVGIGTASPASKLHIAGSLRVDGSIHSTGGLSINKEDGCISIGGSSWTNANGIIGFPGPGERHGQIAFYPSLASSSNVAQGGDIAFLSSGEGSSWSDQGPLTASQDFLDVWVGVLHFKSSSVMSTRECKENIQDIDDLELAEYFDDLNIKSFTYKDQNDTSYGFIAEEVPEFIQQKDNNGDISGYDYIKMNMILVAKIKELEREIQRLKEELK